MPLPPINADEYYPFRACADGLFGGVLKAYRDWKVFGDLDWLKEVWPAVRKSIEFSWAETNLDRWDPDQRGVLHGRMHHTLDMELFSPDPWLTGFYLGALKAGAEMALAVGDTENAALFSSIFEKGYRWVEANLFNGEYFQQEIDLSDRTLIAEQGALDGPVSVSDPDENVYWDEEHSEIKYQVGEGCLSDQLLPQWHASLYGLGDLFDPQQVKTALGSIHRYNFKESLREHFNPMRIYALEDEAGLLMCTYPQGRRRPVFPVPYSHEAWTGVEYSTASLMILNGLVDEGLSIVRAVRERHDGEKRNPWNEFECGSNYARSLASYSLLNAYSGFQFDMTQKMIGFAPVEGRPQPFRCLWSLDPAWGVVAIGTGWAEIQVLGGKLPLKTLRIPQIKTGLSAQATLTGSNVDLTAVDGAFQFTEAIEIPTGMTLVIRWE